MRDSPRCSWCIVSIKSMARIPCRCILWINIVSCICMCMGRSNMCLSSRSSRIGDSQMKLLEMFNRALGEQLYIIFSNLNNVWSVLMLQSNAAWNGRLRWIYLCHVADCVSRYVQRKHWRDRCGLCHWVCNEPGDFIFCRGAACTDSPTCGVKHVRQVFKLGHTNRWQLCLQCQF